LPGAAPAGASNRGGAPIGGAAARRAAAMSAPSPTPGVPEGFRPVPAGGEFIDVNGPLWIRRVGNRAQLGFRVEPRHTNPAGICHGGMMASFCDMLLPLCAHRQEPAVADRFLPTISLQIDYLAPSPLGAWVQGEADVLRTTATLVFMQGLVTADGQPVSRASGVFKIGPPFPSLRRAGDA
jgi:uncharacterized protein (TIGR00369 family)